jgi:hypothetical protein
MKRKDRDGIESLFRVAQQLNEIEPDAFAVFALHGGHRVIPISQRFKNR